MNNILLNTTACDFIYSLSFTHYCVVIRLPTSRQKALPIIGPPKQQPTLFKHNTGTLC